ncbi:Hydrophobin-like protein 4 [Elsinoe fawcettii]|nr:Hydrophobin-like protein 4 [Elsinoe fawcettii]
MLFSTKTTLLLALAASTIASPVDLEKRTDKNTPTNEVANKCSANQKISCCNSKGGLLGLNCVSLPILAIPIGQQCSGDNVVACCNTNQVGLINLNLACLPINIL